jgi:hypothetical protein
MKDELLNLNRHSFILHPCAFIFAFHCPDEPFETIALTVQARIPKIHKIFRADEPEGGRRVLLDASPSALATKFPSGDNFRTTRRINGPMVAGALAVLKDRKEGVDHLQTPPHGLPVTLSPSGDKSMMLARRLNRSVLGRQRLATTLATVRQALRKIHGGEKFFCCDR